MGNWWDERAADLQQKVKMDEYEDRIAYDDDEVGRATVYTRLDLILVISNLSSISKQLRTISRFCFCSLLVLVFILIKI